MRRILARIPEIGLDLRPGFRGLVCFAMILARIQGIGSDLGGFWPGFRGLVWIWEDSGQDSRDWFNDDSGQESADWFRLWEDSGQESGDWVWI